MNENAGIIHYVVALICGLAIIGYVYGVIPLDDITGTDRVGPIFVVLGVYLASKILLVSDLFSVLSQATSKHYKRR
ncbi:MAG: hypothetical protein L0H15_09215 [Nitrosospira sp.]|nr:hypothetical protein [Nitrosospira sp.]